MDKQKHLTNHSSQDSSARIIKPQDDYNFVLKGAKMDIIQPTKEDLQEYEQFKSNQLSVINFIIEKMNQEQNQMLTQKVNSNISPDNLQINILSDNDDSSSNSSLENLGADLNEDLNVVEESFEEESALVNQINQSNYGCEKVGVEGDEPHNISNNLINLPSRYEKDIKKNIQIDEIFINNGNKDMDLSTKIAPESDRQIDEKKAKKKIKVVRPKIQKDEVELGESKKKKKKSKQKRLTMNVSQTKYYVVRYVAKNIYNMRLTHNDEEDWDICWQDGAVQCERLYKMKPYQRINHFAGMYALARKNHLARNLGRMQKKFPDDYKFFPQTFLLPSEYSDFRNLFQNKKKMNKTFIVKPEASCQGRGIFLTRNLDDVNPYDHYVIQRYLHKPFLIEGLKFDLRIYVFLCGVDPLRILMYKEGLSRFATETYQPPNNNNLDNLYMHLTNYAINKTSSKFIQNKNEDADDVGHKRSLTYVWRYLEELGHDVEQVQKDVRQTIIKTICAVQPQLAHIYKSCQPDDVENSMCYEILGFDIFFDANLKPWILEVNHSPSFSTDSPLDFKIKKNLISDTIRLLNLSWAKKQQYKKQKQLEFQKRALKGKPRITHEERETIKQKRIKKRDNFEKKNLGDYELIFPSEENNLDDYQKYLTFAKISWEDFNQGTFKKQKQNESQIQLSQQQLSGTNLSENNKSSVLSTKDDKKKVPGFISEVGSLIEKGSVLHSAQKNMQKPQSARRENKQDSLHRKDSLKDLTQTINHKDQFSDPNQIDHRGISQRYMIQENNNQIQQQILESNYNSTSDYTQAPNTLPKAKQAHIRPPSGRVRIQLDPNSSEFYNNSTNKRESRQMVQIVTKQNSKGKNEQIDLTDSKYNPSTAIQTTSLSLQNSQNINQTAKSLLQVQPRYQEDITLNNTLHQISKTTQNKDPNIQKSHNNNQTVSNIYKNSYSNLDKQINLKPINTFERFLKNLTAGGVTAGNSQMILSKDSSNSAQALNHLPQGRTSFQYDADMNIKSINSSGVILGQSNGQADNNNYNAMRGNLYKPRIQISADRKRTQSQNRANSAKVAQNQNIPQRTTLQKEDNYQNNTVLQTNSNNYRNLTKNGKHYSIKVTYRWFFAYSVKVNCFVKVRLVMVSIIKELQSKTTVSSLQIQQFFLKPR
ncbi:tubulin-tyrosine ligase family protein [Stylonychia lemnae]|uniref:Tubulin-tyrosine ligase family protein n=1 Tax=Stylonychia lemnae TaxID=5949 RepID=A0A078AR45_STYLE|nr:tubulin-tyrosine ligase family protein [Stylonychia lemnae]|eukprot:CDW83353.1 tubulin-tyrosine ligase family protein [Stylonychia lemnae]